MRLINQTQNTVLAEDIYLADTLLKRIKGLLGRKEFLLGQGLILEPCNSVHTFFMRFPIDLLFVDNNYRIIKALPGFVPNRISRIYWKSHLAIELPRGILKLTKTQDTDQLRLEKNYGRTMDRFCSSYNAAPETVHYCYNAAPETVHY